MKNYIGHKIADGIYETTNLSAFKFGNNRIISKENVNRKIASIKKYGQLVPIEVTSDYYIKDGQHRYIALSQLNMPVIYRFSLNDTYNPEEIAEMNSMVEKWKTQNYIDVYADSMNPSFVRIKRLTDKYPDLRWGDISLALSMDGSNYKIKTGSVFVSEEDYLRADNLLHQTTLIYSLIANSPYASMKYFRVFINLLKYGLCDYELLYDAMKKRKQWLWQDSSKPTTIDDALKRIEFAYNYRLLEKNRIDVIKEYQRLRDGRKK